MGWGSRIRIKPIQDLGSRGRKSTRSRIRNTATGPSLVRRMNDERTLPKAAPEPPGWAGEDCACAGLAAGLLGWDPLTLQSKTITFINMYYVLCTYINSS